ncbi:MAG: GspH/FimT family pseudopilin [Steroidobacteraceae bacterium]
MPVMPGISRGHTLPELLVTFGIVAVIAVAAVPTFANLLLDSRRTAMVTTAMHAINLARQLAAVRGETMLLCGTADQLACSGHANWSTGLLILDEGDRLRRSIPLATATRAPQMRANRVALNFEGGSGFASPATLTICDRRGADAARAIIISRSGRPRVSARDASDRPLAC